MHGFQERGGTIFKNHLYLQESFPNTTEDEMQEKITERMEKQNEQGKNQ